MRAPLRRLPPSGRLLLLRRAQYRAVTVTDTGRARDSQEGSHDVGNDGQKRLLAVAAAAIGGSAILFSAIAVIRSKGEKHEIQSLFDKHTSVRDLERIVDQGGKLPPVAIVCGQLQNDGPAVEPYLGEKKDLAVSQVLMTRLSPRVWMTQLKDPDGKVTGEEPGRTPKAVRYNVMAERREADGLHLRGKEGGEAAVQLPSVAAELASGGSPSLYLTATDAAQEFFASDELRSAVKEKSDAPPDAQDTAMGATGSKFVHMSKFVSVDQQPRGDLPSYDMRAWADVLPSGAQWLWNPKGFYDACSATSGPSYASYPDMKLVSPSKFETMAWHAAKENNKRSQYQDKKKRPLTPELRDHEYGYRMVQVDIPSGEAVTVVGKPVVTDSVQQQDGQLPISKEYNQALWDSYTSAPRPGPGKNPSRRITFTEPDQTTDTGTTQFRLRILKGHEVSNLLSQRDQSKMQYTAMGTVGTLMVAWSGAILGGFV